MNKADAMKMTKMRLALAASKARVKDLNEIINTYSETIKVLNESLAALAARPVPAPQVNPVTGVIHPGANMASFAAQMDPDDDDDDDDDEPKLTVTGLHERINELWGDGHAPKEDDFIPGTAWNQEPLEQTEKET